MPGSFTQPAADAETGADRSLRRSRCEGALRRLAEAGV